jgi:hypothetical protein
MLRCASGAFSDGAHAVAARQRDLLARLNAARMRPHEIVILRMKTWLPEELKGPREAELFRGEQVGMHFRILERFPPGTLAALSSKDESDSRK